MIIQNVKKLIKEKRLTMGVTNIINIVECPLQSIYYSSIFPHRNKLLQSLAFVVGSISHRAFEIFYDDYERNVNDDIDSVVERLFNKSVIMLNNDKENSSRYNFFVENKSRVKISCFKYIKTFIKWAKFMPMPYKRELLLRKGLVVGVIDRIDVDNNSIIITDYKTADSIPAEEYLLKYKLQIGGYMWLVNKTSLNRFNILVPRIVVFRRNSWKTILIEDWYNYVEDFDFLVKEAAKVLIDLSNNKLPSGDKLRNKCYYCLAKDFCIYNK